MYFKMYNKIVYVTLYPIIQWINELEGILTANYLFVYNLGMPIFHKELHRNGK